MKRGSTIVCLSSAAACTEVGDKDNSHGQDNVTDNHTYQCHRLDPVAGGILLNGSCMGQTQEEEEEG